VVADLEDDRRTQVSCTLSPANRVRLYQIREIWTTFDRALEHKDVQLRAASLRFKFALEDLEDRAGVEVVEAK